MYDKRMCFNLNIFTFFVESYVSIEASGPCESCVNYKWSIQGSCM